MIKMKENQISLTFDDTAKETVLEYMDKKINKDCVIVEKQDASQRVLSVEGEEVSIDEFGGIRKGSEVFIKNDLISLMRLSKE